MTCPIPTDPDIIDLGDYRVRRGRRDPSSPPPCPHNTIVFNEAERTIWCEDCTTQLDPFDAFMRLCQHFERIVARLKDKEARAEEALTATLHRRAAKAFERAWNGGLAPTCPHCRRAMLPEDLEGGTGGMNVEFERKRRGRERSE